MLEDLTIHITEQVNGARLTCRYRLEPKGNFGFRHSANSIIGRLNKVFTRIGYQLSTDGTTSTIFGISGKASTFNKE